MSLNWQMPEGWVHHTSRGVYDVVAVVTHAHGGVWSTRMHSDERVENDRRGEDWCAEVVERQRARLCAPTA